MYIKSGSINANLVQEYIFWFIDINNMLHENDCCFNAIIRLMWKAIQQQIDFIKLGIDIGQFNKNNTGVVCGKFKELIMSYHNDLDMNKKVLYKSQLRKQLQKVFDYYFNKSNNNKKNINVYDNNKLNNKNNKHNSDMNVPNLSKSNLDDSNNFNKNNLNAYQSIDTHLNNNQNQNRKNPHSQKKDLKNNNNINNFNNKNNFNNNNNINNNTNNNNVYNNNNLNNNYAKSKLSILCITWNVAGIPSENKYDIRDLLTQKVFYKNNHAPDIILIGMEEIVELDIYNVFTITTNEDSVFDWTQNIT